MTKYAHTIASFIKIKQISNLKCIIHVIPVNSMKTEGIKFYKHRFSFFQEAAKKTMEDEVIPNFLRIMDKILAENDAENRSGFLVGKTVTDVFNVGEQKIFLLWSI